MTKIKKNTTMRKTKIILVIVTFLINGMVYSQINKPETKKDIGIFEKDSIRTNVYTINLCSPDQRSVSNNSLNNRLSLKNKNLLSIILKNCNPKKYIYRINSEPIAFNKDASEFKQLIDSVKKNFFSQSTITNQVTQKTNEIESAIKINKEKNEDLDKRVVDIEKNIFKGRINVDSIDRRRKENYQKFIYNLPDWYNEPSDYANNESKILADKLKRERYRQRLQFAAKDIKKFEEIIKLKDPLVNFKTGELISTIIDNMYSNISDSVIFDAINEEYYQIIYYINQKHTDALSSLNSISSKMEGECIDDSTLITIGKLKEQHLANVILFSKLKSLYNFRNFTSNFIDDEIAKGVNMESVITSTLDNYSKLNTQVSPPFPVSSNLTNIDLIRVKIERIDISTQLSKEVTYDFWLKGGFKIDFSAGIFATSLRDDEFYFKSDPTNPGNKAIFKKNNGQYNFGFGSMMNVMLRTGASWITPGLSLGAIFTAQQKFQILTGLSVAIGKQERIVLHGGVAIGFAKRLDTNYESTSLGNEKYYDFGENSTLVPTDDRFKSKVFWGITYNISGGSPFNSIGK